MPAFRIALIFSASTNCMPDTTWPKMVYFPSRFGSEGANMMKNWLFAYPGHWCAPHPRCRA